MRAGKLGGDSDAIPTPEHDGALPPSSRMWKLPGSRNMYIQLPVLRRLPQTSTSRQAVKWRQFPLDPNEREKCGVPLGPPPFLLRMNVGTPVTNPIAAAAANPLNIEVPRWTRTVSEWTWGSSLYSISAGDGVLTATLWSRRDVLRPRFFTSLSVRWTWVVGKPISSTEVAGHVRLNSKFARTFLSQSIQFAQLWVRP